MTYTDTLRLGTLRVDSVPVQAAVTIPPALENQTDQSGVLGLSKPSTNKTSISSLIRSGLDTPIVSVDLRRNATGRIDFGAVADPTTPLESISWLPGPQPPSERWDVDWETMGWLGGRGGTWHDLPFRATVDTATTLLFLPQGLAGLYWSDVPGMRVDPRLDNAYTFPCNYAGNLPDLLFRLPGSDEGRFVKVPGSYLNYGPVTGDEYGGNSTADGYCWGGMQGAKNLNVAVVGDIMLKAVVVAFDLDKGLVGFANKTLTE